MKRMDWIKLTAINLLFIVSMVLPFLPGPPNKLVIGLSIFGQAMGFFGLLLIPIGICWAVLETRKNTGKANPDGIVRLAIASTAIIGLMYLVMLIGLFVSGDLFFGFLALLPGTYALWSATRGIRDLKKGTRASFRVVPVYLMSIPLLAFITRMFILGPVSEYSRNVTIQRSQSLITAIENYKIREGQYPESIENLKMQMSGPSIMGVLDFRYHKINDQYSLSFSQWLEFGSLEEIVLYDKSNLINNLSGQYAAYDYGFDLCRVKGAFADYDTGYEDWRYYWAD